MNDPNKPRTSPEIAHKWILGAMFDEVVRREFSIKFDNFPCEWPAEARCMRKLSILSQS